MRRFLVPVLTLFALTALLTAAPGPQANDDPKDVAWRFAVAAERGDVAAARALCDGGKLDLFLDILQDMSAARDALREAAMARFGEAADGLDMVQPNNSIRLSETTFP